MSPRSRNVDADGGSGQITIAVSSGCSWTAQSTVGWIDITSGETGNGSGVVRYEVDRHRGRGARTGRITIGGQSVTITQQGDDRDDDDENDG